MLRAIIVDDEELAVKRLRNLLSERDEIEICHAFMNPWDAYAFVKENPVELAFLDISMPEVNGMKLSRLLLQVNAEMDIVFVTGYDNYAVQAFDMSALDYLMKPVTEQRILKTLDKIRKRHQRTSATPTTGTVRTNEGVLTEQETRIVQFISMGLSNKEIAYQLTISAETVKSHIKNVYRKLGVNNRVQVLQRAKEINPLI